MPHSGRGDRDDGDVEGALGPVAGDAGDDGHGRRRVVADAVGDEIDRAGALFDGAQVDDHLTGRGIDGDDTRQLGFGALRGLAQRDATQQTDTAPTADTASPRALGEP